MTIMVRDPREEWPSDVPVGTFDIELGGVQGIPEAIAHIIFVCPNAKRCSVFLGDLHVNNFPGGASVWKWDGNMDKPTITPSINCLTHHDGKPAGGCGWHGFITAGEIK